MVQQDTPSTIVHDIVDAPLEQVADDAETAQEEAETAREENVEIAAAVIDHVMIDAQEHESLRVQLAAANAQIAELETRWREQSTVGETAAEAEQEAEQTIQSEPIDVEIAAPPTVTAETKKQKRYLFNHPLR